MTSPNDSHDTEDADTKETDPNADLYEQDLPSSLSTRLSSLFMLAQNDGSTNTSNRAETSTKATSRDTRAKSPVPAKSSDSAQRAEWEAIARAHTEWEKNQPAIPGVRKEESESDDERTGKEVQEEEANEFSLFIEMHEHVYSSALKNLHGEERLILPEPWHTHGEDAPLRKLTQHPALFKAYRRQEERIIVLLRERMAHLISKYPQTPALLREKSNTWMELRQHQKILATISTVKFVEEIIARMQEKMVRDLRRQDRTDTTPAWPTAHSLLNLLRDDAKCKELRKRVYRMQEVEQEYFPWRYDGVSEIFLGSSRPSVSPPPDYSTATGTVTPTSAQRSGVTFQDGPQEECRDTQGSPSRGDTDEPREPSPPKTGRSCRKQRQESSDSELHTRAREKFRRNFRELTLPFVTMAFPPPSPSPASPSSSEKDTDVQSPETQPSTDPSEATQASASDNPSTPILSVPGSNFLTPAAARTPTHSRDDAAGPPDMRPPASRLNDRLGLALRSTRDGTVKQQRFNDTPDLPESGESSHTRVSGWLDGSAPTGEIDAAREEQGSTSTGAVAGTAAASPSTRPAGNVSEDLDDRSAHDHLKKRDSDDEGDKGPERWEMSSGPWGKRKS